MQCKDRRQTTDLVQNNQSLCNWTQIQSLPPQKRKEINEKILDCFILNY